jgi:hypothetical protein
MLVVTVHPSACSSCTVPLPACSCASVVLPSGLQLDIHTAATTVAEALWFSARLRLAGSLTDDQVMHA